MPRVANSSSAPGPNRGAACCWFSARRPTPRSQASRRWLQADGAGQVRFELTPAEGLQLQLWRSGGPAAPRAVSRIVPLARPLRAIYQGPPCVISEFMKDPTDVADSRGEWVEITNLLPWRLNLEGWVLSDDGSNAAILGGGPAILRCGPGASIVVGADADPLTNGGVPVLGEWSGFTLTNSSDEIILSTPDGVVVDRIDYDDGVLWPDSPGRSIALDPAAHDVMLNDDPSNWCHSQTSWAGGGTDTGTPGSPNDACL
jgi:Lamin Tail Domain